MVCWDSWLWGVKVALGSYCALGCVSCSGVMLWGGSLLWGDALGRSCSGEGKFSLGVKVALGR
ncbi:MAG: hypothetical protein KBC30_08620 [Planctomycetes bacterium]|nr:hypothetical protein [Planctomycetota bacterium]